MKQSWLNGTTADGLVAHTAAQHNVGDRADVVCIASAFFHRDPKPLSRKCVDGGPADGVIRFYACNPLGRRKGITTTFSTHRRRGHFSRVVQRIVKHRFLGHVRITNFVITRGGKTAARREAKTPEK